jgi:hypothetical protein
MSRFVHSAKQGRVAGREKQSLSRNALARPQAFTKTPIRPLRKHEQDIMTDLVAKLYEVSTCNWEDPFIPSDTKKQFY